MDWRSIENRFLKSHADFTTESMRPCVDVPQMSLDSEPWRSAESRPAIGCEA